MTSKNPLGRVTGIWRYPVKSMAGETLDSCEITPRGLLGDRAYALVDDSTGMVASAKNPRVWPGMLEYRAAFVEPPQSGRPLHSVSITLPDGRIAPGDRAAVDLSAAFGRKVGLSSVPPEKPVLEQFWPDDDRVSAEAMPTGTFFDLGVLNLLMTTTLSRLSAAYPQGSFDVRRFRPNILVTPSDSAVADPEAACVGRTLAIGEVRLHVEMRCGRCVMTTLAQADLPKDPGILRTIAKANDGFAGVYLRVVQPGIIRNGDEVRFVD